MLLQDRAEQARHAIAECDQVRLEPLGIAVEHRAQILDRSARRTRHDARGGDEVAHIGVLRAQLQRLGVSVRRFLVLAEAGQRVAEQAERAGIGDAGMAGVLGQPDRLAKIAAADAKQDRGVARIDPPGRGSDAAQQRGEGGVGVAGRFLRRGQSGGKAGIAWLGTICLIEACQGVRRAPQLQHQHAEQCLGGGVGVVQHHGFRGIARAAFDVAGVPAQLGAALAQSGMAGGGFDGLVQFRRRVVRGGRAQREPRADVGYADGPGCQAPCRGEQWAGGADAARGDQLRGPFGQDVCVGVGVQFLHGGPLLGLMMGA